MKIKSVSELMNLFAEAKETENYAQVFNYIDFLHNALKNYQLVIDLVISKNQNINNV